MGYMRVGYINVLSNLSNFSKIILIFACINQVPFKAVLVQFCCKMITVCFDFMSVAKLITEKKQETLA